MGSQRLPLQKKFMSARRRLVLRQRNRVRNGASNKSKALQRAAGFSWKRDNQGKIDNRRERT